MIKGLRAFCVLIAVSLVSAASSADTLRPEALREIERVAESICGKYTYKSNSRNFAIEGDAKAELNGFIEKFADIGVTGLAKFESEEFDAVFRQDIPNEHARVTRCKLQLFDKLYSAAISDNAVDSQGANPEKMNASIDKCVRNQTKACQEFLVYAKENVDLCNEKADILLGNQNHFQTYRSCGNYQSQIRSIQYHMNNMNQACYGSGDQSAPCNDYRRSVAYSAKALIRTGEEIKRYLAY